MAAEELTQLLDLTSGLTPFLAAHGEPYISLPLGDGGHEVCPIASGLFEDWLLCGFDQSEGHPPGPYYVRQALRTLAARAMNGPKLAVHHRIAAHGNLRCPDAIYIHLGNRTGQSIEITAAHIEVVSDNTIAFAEHFHTAPLAEPAPVATPLRSLEALLNLASPADAAVVVNWLLAAHQPSGPYPILVLEGLPGSGKSAAARRLRSLVDPSSTPLHPIPSSDRELHALAQQNWLLAFDHVGPLRRSASDTLCRLSTGITTIVRSYPLEIARPIMITAAEGWKPSAHLQHRIVTAHLAANAPTRPASAEAFEDERPRLQRAIYQELQSRLIRPKHSAEPLAVSSAVAGGSRETPLPAVAARSLETPARLTASPSDRSATPTDRSASPRDRAATATDRSASPRYRAATKRSAKGPAAGLHTEEELRITRRRGSVLRAFLKSGLPPAHPQEQSPFHAKLRVGGTQQMLPLPFRMLFKYRPFLLLPLLSFAANLPDPPRLRLGDNVRPVHYAIDLTLAPDQDTFEGKADIDVSVGAPSSLIWLNATQIEIRQAAFEAAGATMPATVVAGGDNFIGLQLTKPVSGAGALHLAYTGKISRNSSAGLFQMKESGRWYVYSQFEPTDARRAFPSFDEPGFKVPWQLTLHVPAEDMALSNTPVESETPASGGLKTVRFAQTKPLPSYLVALAVGPFDAVSAGKVGRAPLRIIVPHGRGSEAKFAVEAVPALLKLLEDYFGSPYPYEKLDSVVMPIANFAMENVGLITYPESLLLGNPQTDSSERRRECAITVAHEMAHQWFGDLVTTAWWDDIWLNEAFATWMETKMVGEWKPEWKADVGAVESKLGAMNLDSLISARRIRQPIRTDNDIANAFDGITYEKGAAVIRMFENWIGSDKFRKGTRLYLKQHANGNATTADFEAAISTAAGKDIAPAFNSFLDQPGVPELTVALDCSAKKPRLTMSQKRSLPIGSPGSAPQTWQIPVCVKYAGGGDKQECTLVADPRSDIVLNHAHGCPAWLLANNKEIGYYRVNYQNGLLAQLLKQSAEELSVPERAGILGDLKALVDSGDVSPKLALSFVPQFGRENERHIVAGALSIAELLTSDSVPAELRPKGAAFIREVFGPHASELGWKPREDDDDNTRLLRETLVPEVASEGEQKQLITEAERLARHWIEDRKSLTPDMAPRVLSVAAEFGNRDLFDRLHAAALKEKNQRTREVLVGSLSEFRNREIAQAALDLLLSNDFDIRESFWNLFGPLAYPETRDLPFRWVQQHLDELLKRLPREVGEDFAADLPSVGKRFCDADKRAEVEAFFKDRVKDYVGGPRTLAKTLESIDLCMARKKVLGPELAAFLETRPD